MTDDRPDQAQLERNLSLFSVHEILVRFSPWISVFVLFTRSNFDLDGAVLLASIYYLSVVVVEVPSGWMSDRLGRALTLRFASIAWLACFACFLFSGSNFVVVALGQFLLALGYGSLSGTDVAFHFDTLEALGRADEYADRQARISSRGLLAAAAAALAGGALGLIDVRLAFGASLAVAAVQVAVAFRFVEPPRTAGDAEAIGRQVGHCLRYLRVPGLGWLFGYGVAMVVLEHVAFTLLQPWLTEALDRTADDFGSAPLFAGGMIASSYLVGSAFARWSVAAAGRLGMRSTLVALGALSAVIVTVMSVSTHLAVLVLIAFRSAQGSAAPVLSSAAVAPHVMQRHRATFLSLNSLGGRLAYGGLLLVVSTDATDDVARTLGQLSLVSWVLVAITAVTAIVVPQLSPPSGESR